MLDIQRVKFVSFLDKAISHSRIPFELLKNRILLLGIRSTMKCVIKGGLTFDAIGNIVLTSEIIFH